VLDELTADERQLRRELAARVHRLQEREVVPSSRCVVVRAERGSHVHHARAVVRAHERFPDDDLVIRSLGIRQPIDRPTIARPH
jgi:hypothetical protein